MPKPGHLILRETRMSLYMWDILQISDFLLFWSIQDLKVVLTSYCFLLYYKDRPFQCCFKHHSLFNMKLNTLGQNYQAQNLMHPTVFHSNYVYFILCFKTQIFWMLSFTLFKLNNVTATQHLYSGITCNCYGWAIFQSSRGKVVHCHTNG